MMSAGSDASCPTLEALEQFVAERRPDGPIATHVVECEACAITVAAITEDNALLGEFVSANTGRLSAERPITVGDAPEGYVIIDEIHRGSQGVVYRALQEATKRTVALKITLHGAFAGERQRMRFEREVQLVASLQHPGIVTVYDSGVTPDGRPFLAMELVEGRTLDAFMRDETPTIRATLELFTAICDAVAGAHQRGIIHRDLKPANIVVDATGAPRVLDFGVAKIVGAERAAAAPLATVAGEFLGTFAYAAPEQLSGDPSLVDTRVDEYALGVILYEMLTGRRPYALEGSMQAVMRTILEVVPAPPSTLRPEIDADVDTIVGRCLEKDPGRRYQSVYALLEDIRRTLAGEPINARRDERWYVLRRTLARHKREMAAVCAVFVLVCATALTGWVLYRQRVVLTQRKDASLRSLLQTITSLDVEDPDAPMPVKDFLELLDVSSTIVLELEDFPEDEALVRTSLGLAYLAHSRFDDADEHLRRVYAIERRDHDSPHPHIAAALHNLGRAHWKAGRYDDALRAYNEALTMRRALYGEEHVDVARTMHHLASTLRDMGRLEEGLAISRDALAMRRRLLPAQSPDIGNSLNGVGKCLFELARFDEAAECLREALAILHAQPVPEDVALRQTFDWRASRARHNLACCLVESGELDDAERLLVESLKVKRRFRDESDPDVASGVHELARVWFRQNRIDEAEAGCRAALAAREIAYREDHPEVADSLTLLGEILLARGNNDQACEALRRAMAIREATTQSNAWSYRQTRALLERCALSPPPFAGEG